MFDNGQGGALPQTTRREGADHYENVVFTDANYRVIVCRDGIQWIIQHRRGKSGAGARWRSCKYCVTRKALIRDWLALTGVSHNAIVKLPKRIGGAL